jgi:hypothetical protein
MRMGCLRGVYRLGWLWVHQGSSGRARGLAVRWSWTGIRTASARTDSSPWLGEHLAPRCRLFKSDRIEDELSDREMCDGKHGGDLEARRPSEANVMNETTKLGKAKQQHRTGGPRGVRGTTYGTKYGTAGRYPGNVRDGCHERHKRAILLDGEGRRQWFSRGIIAHVSPNRIPRRDTSWAVLPVRSEA